MHDKTIQEAESFYASVFFLSFFCFLSILASGFPIVQTHLKNKTLTSFVAQSFGNEDGT